MALSTSRDVYNRIRWDARYDPRRFVIGYVERGLEGYAEKRFDEWDGTIPWHRVHYFAVGGVRVWDRDAGIDRVTSGEALALAAMAPRAEAGPGGGFTRLQVRRWSGEKWEPVESDAPRAAVRLPLRVATWNVLSDRHDPGLEVLERRLQRAFSVLEALGADVIALEEVTPRILDLVLARPWVRASYRTTDASGETLGPEGTLVLSRVPFDAESHVFPNQKRAVLARLDVAGRPLEIVALHATSDRAKDARRKRAQELDRIAARIVPARGAARGAGGEPHALDEPDLLDALDALIIGDLNARDEDPGGLGAHGFVDVWRALRPGEPGFTYDPTTNALTARTSTSGIPARFDRALFRGHALDAVRIERFGNTEVPTSDHDGLVLEIVPAATIDAAPVPTTALAILVPEALREPIDAIRRKHDPAYPRWMPHANLLFGFVPAERLAEAAGLVERATLATSPFVVTLAHFEVFEHRASATVHLVPECQPALALERLQQDLARRFPGCGGTRGPHGPGSDTRGFVPHVTVGRFESVESAREHAARLEREWQPISFRARSVALIARSGDAPFKVEHDVFLGLALESWLARRGELESAARAAVRERATTVVRECVRALDPTGEVHVVGSVRLGVARASSDIDLLVVGVLDPAAFAAALEKRLETAVRLAPDARVPVLRLELEGLPVDVQIAPPGEGALEPCQVADELRARGEALAPRGAFATVVRALRAWASARFLDSQAWGYPGGFAWAVLATWGLEGAGPGEAPEDLLARVLERAHATPWPEAFVAAARTLTSATRAVVLAELARGAEVARSVLAGEATWDGLASPASLEGLTRVAWLRVEPRGTPAGEAGRGFLERAGVGLVLDLERTPGVTRVRPFAARGASIAIGLRGGDAGAVESRLERVAREVAQEVQGARLEWRVEPLEERV